MARLRDSLSLKIISLTLLLASMTLIAALIAIHSLSQFKDDTQKLKNRHLSELIKMSELRGQSQEIIDISVAMFAVTNLTELESVMVKLSHKKQHLDKSIEQLQGDSIPLQTLRDLKRQFDSHIEAAVAALAYKYQLEDKFFTYYRSAQTLKQRLLSQSNTQLYALMDRALSHFNPTISENNEEYLATDLKALNLAVDSPFNGPDTDEQLQIRNLFIDQAWLQSSYRDYIDQTEKINKLRNKNEYFTELFASLLGSELLALQNNLVNALSKLEYQTDKQKLRLYPIIFIGFLATFFLALIQFVFIKRIIVMRNVIDSGYSKNSANLPIIKGTDELSKMAESVKEYIEQLLKKEQEVITLNTRLSHLASHDDLTAVFNRRYFERFLKHENERYLRYKEKYCLAMIDLDYLKKVNDNYGHDGGDAVIVDFSRRASALIRKTDIFARYGGEEFVLLMPNTTEKNALLLLERMRVQIASEPCRYNHHKISFSISVGLAEVQKTEHPEMQDKQLTFADLALYQAKKSGRNKVCVFNPVDMSAGEGRADKSP